MIRDPSDGSVREKPEVAKLRNHATPDTGLRQPPGTDAQIRLERSREWLKSYFEEQQNARGNDGKERSADGDSSNDQGQA